MEFQDIKNSKEKVHYVADAILPDANVQKWVIDIAKQYVTQVQNESSIVQ